MKAGRPPTELELIVLRRIATTASPYVAGGNRWQSQAFSRLKQLGYAHYNYDTGSYQVTEAGKAFL